MNIYTRAQKSGHRKNHHATALLSLSLLAPLSSHASEIATNIALSFNETVDFSQQIDKWLTLDAATVNARLLTTRLGTFSSGDVVFTLNSNHSVSVLDAGVTTPTAEERDFFQVSGNTTATGGPLSTSVSLNLGAHWVCPANISQCNSNEVFTPLKSSTTTMAIPADISILLNPIHVQSSAITVTPLGEGYTLNFGRVHANGSLQVNAKFTTKTMSQYVTDALAATPGSGSSRWLNAATDIQAVRNGNWTDVAVDNSLRAGLTPELEQAHRYLAIARDSATLLATGNASGAAFNSQFALTKQLWNLAAAEPSLGRDFAGTTSENFFSTAIAAEVAIMRMILNGADDTSFVAGLESALSNPLAVGSAAALTFDGSLIGMNGATMSVFYLEGDSSGRVNIDLAAADRYAFWRSAYTFDRIAFIEGAAGSLTVQGGSYDGTSIGLGEETTVIGESDMYRDVPFYLSGNQAASRLQLNNFYNKQLLIVATWEATPVPEPSALCMLLFGLVLVGRIKKIA